MVSWKTRSAPTRPHFPFFVTPVWLTPFLICRCILPRRRTRTASSARNTRNSRLLNTRRERTPSKPRVLVVTLPSSQVSAVRPSPFSERRPSRPRRSPSDLSAPSARLDAANSSADARLSSSVSIPPRTRLVPSSESSKASGKAPTNRLGDELHRIGLATGSFQRFSRKFLFFIIYILYLLSLALFK